MKLEIKQGEFHVVLTAHSARGIKKLSKLIADLRPATDKPIPDEQPFGFTAGEGLFTDNVGQEQEDRWPELAVISSRPSPQL